MTALPLRRRPVPDGPIDDALIGFIEAHPVLTTPFDPRWGLSRLVLGPGSVIDAVDAGGSRVAIAAVVDACVNAANSANLVLLCLHPEIDRDALAGFLLAEAEAITAAGPRGRLEVEHRGGGLGDILVAESLRRLHAAGAGSAALTVAAVNDAALALYRRHGFVVAETIPVYVKDFPAAG
jgi:GNAT superfamily N-acetyltransferase